MSLIGEGDLDRRSWLRGKQSHAWCGDCDWDEGLMDLDDQALEGEEYDKISPAQAGRKARGHARETGHVTFTASIKVTRYRPVRREGKQ